MAVRFMEGFAPVLTGWSDGLCPACCMRAARERAARMSRDEQREAIIEELRRDPDATVDELVRRTGSTLAGRVRKEAVGRGIATPANEVAARTRQQRERRRREGKRQEAGVTAEAVKGTIGADPGCGVADLAERFGVSSATIRRRLRTLVEAGEVEARSTGRGRSRVTYRATV